MDERNEFWNVFTQTGRVEDYLRYRGYEAPKEATAGETEDGRTGDPRNAGGRSG